MAEPGTAPASEIVFYQGEDGRSRIQVRLDGATVWLTQRPLADLYQVSVPTINEHVANIFDEQELDPSPTIRKFRIVQTEGTREVSRLVDHFNLEVILAVGYRVRSHRGMQFRRWATERLTEYLIKGFVMDDERLKEGRSFFQVLQNKLHWAITGSTAAEIITERASAEKPNMGLTTWKGAKVRKADVTVAKNYLNDDEIRQLNRIVTMDLDYAEEQGERRKPLYMRDWREKLDAFLKFNERDILQSAGRVSADVAQGLALGEYEKFGRQRLAEEAQAPDEFEKAAKQLAPNKPGKGERS
jgi:hypothetical protein